MLVFTKLLSFIDRSTVVIAGLGREGTSTYTFLRRYGPTTTTYILADAKPESKLSTFWKQEIKKHQLTFTQLGKQSTDWSEVQYIAVTPGISDRVLSEKYGVPAEIPKITNSGLFFELAMTASRGALTTIGVTGTKGKSTTTAAIYHVLKESGLLCVLGGNIGLPPLDALEQLFEINHKNPYKKLNAVLELSSHQLSRLRLSPQIAVVQAITPEHLDYYLRFGDYLDAKTAICKFQVRKNIVFYNKESKTAKSVAKLSKGKKVGFGLENSPVDPSKVTLPGQHNVLNLTPAILIAEYLGIDPQTALSKVYSFTGLPHRLQPVIIKNAPEKDRKSEKVTRFYNDSLSTTPESAMAAIESFTDPVVLIAGGYDRGLEYASLGAFLARAAQAGKLRGLVYFDPSGERMIDAISKYDPNLKLSMSKVETMAEAVAEAKKLAEPGDVVLLSPASASFGRFKDYADRGEQFMKAVQSE